MNHVSTVNMIDQRPAEMRGYVDRCDQHAISGWIVDFSDTKKTFSVKVLIDGVEVCCVPAEGFRADLAEHPALHGTPHAYRIVLPESLLTGQVREVRVIEKESGYELAGSPAAVAFLKPFVQPPQHLDVALVGKEGWLFLCHDSNGCIEQYIGSLGLTQQMLDEYAQQYAYRQEILRAKNIKYILAAAPGKEYVYPEYLPDSVMARQDSTVLGQFIAAVAPLLDEPVIDLGAVLLANKALGQLCYKRDSHWNYLGAMIASSHVIGRARKYFPCIPEFDAERFKLSVGPEPGGDLGKKARLGYANGNYLAVDEESDAVTAECAINVSYDISALEVADHPYKNLSKTRPTRLFRKEQAAPLPRAIIIRDSYADWMIPYLSEFFSEALFIWTRNLDEEVLSSFKPDIFIEEVVDRFLIKNRAAAARIAHQVN